MMEWIKPSELPERFHGECWIVWKSWGEMIHPAKIYTVQNYYRGTIPEYWTGEGYYSALNDREYRLMILEKPVATLEDFV